MYARSDITALAKGNSYSRLQWEEVTVGQALSLAQQPNQSWPQVMPNPCCVTRTAIVKAGVYSVHTVRRRSGRLGRCDMLGGRAELVEMVLRSSDKTVSFPCHLLLFMTSAASVLSCMRSFTAALVTRLTRNFHPECVSSSRHQLNCQSRRTRNLISAKSFRAQPVAGSCSGTWYSLIRSPLSKNRINHSTIRLCVNQSLWSSLR